VISEHAVLSYFAQAKGRGWSLLNGSLSAGWHATFKGRLRDFITYLDIDSEWVYLQCPIIQVEALDSCKEQCYERLLRYNDRMFLAKFTLFQAEPRANAPHEDWVALVVECPVDVFDAAMFRIMTDAIATYADEYFGAEVQVLAREEQLLTRT
jgi:hypothetical protein